jgi:hypothetical protein
MTFMTIMEDKVLIYKRSVIMFVLITAFVSVQILLWTVIF